MTELFRYPADIFFGIEHRCGKSVPQLVRVSTIFPMKIVSEYVIVPLKMLRKQIWLELMNRSKR